jgi:hypothetical protein
MTEELKNPITGEEIKTQQFALRFNSDEQSRYEEMIRRAFERNKLARLSDINRELLGLRDSGLFSQADLAYFRGQPEAPLLKANVPKSSSRPKEAKTDAPISQNKRKIK